MCTVLSRIMTREFIPLQQLFTVYLNLNFLQPSIKFVGLNGTIRDKMVYVWFVLLIK